MEEGIINGNGIPCVFTRFSGAANNDRPTKGSPAILDAGRRLGTFRSMPRPPTILKKS